MFEFWGREGGGGGGGEVCGVECLWKFGVGSCCLYGLVGWLYFVDICVGCVDRGVVFVFFFGVGGSEDCCCRFGCGSGWGVVMGLFCIKGVLYCVGWLCVDVGVGVEWVECDCWIQVCGLFGVLIGGVCGMCDFCIYEEGGFVILVIFVGWLQFFLGQVLVGVYWCCCIGLVGVCCGGKGQLFVELIEEEFGVC